MQTYIRVWSRNKHTFIDIVRGTSPALISAGVEFKRIEHRAFPNVSREVSWHVRRLVWVTGYKVVNETDLCL